ncbi:hypothetical protein GJ744_008899 [Endocarpon pusillum]|uniref:Uncharacterized protein n=1 Tax=Endocarpon pusillum TaxID=364733 RepID=A0A8H7AYS2_9EURO|nr:hypothetical protein GJ744_008899 [Endocarpon pusillum]
MKECSEKQIYVIGGRERRTNIGKSETDDCEAPSAGSTLHVGDGEWKHPLRDCLWVEVNLLKIRPEEKLTRPRTSTVEQPAQIARTTAYGDQFFAVQGLEHFAILTLLHGSLHCFWFGR